MIGWRTALIPLPSIQPTVIAQQTDTQLVLTAPSFFTELFVVNLGAATCLYGSFITYQRIWQPPDLETGGPLFNGFGSLFCFAMAIVLVKQIKLAQTITLDKAVNELIWQGRQWLGFRSYEFRYPLDTITAVRVWQQNRDSDNRYVVGVMVGETVGCRLPASAMVTGYSQVQSAEIAHTLREFLNLPE